jgi:hypothetical protein
MCVLNNTITFDNQLVNRKNLMKQVANFRILFLLWIGLQTSLISQNCDYNKSIPDDPIAQDSFFAENTIGSSGTVNPPDSVLFSAGNEIRLLPDFEVNSGSFFHAYIEGCEPTCPSVNPCIDGGCKTVYDTLTTNAGFPFYAHEMIITYPDSIQVTEELNDNIIFVQLQNGQTKAIDLDTLVKNIYGLPPNVPNGRTEKCLCDKNIYRYKNTNILMEESGIGQASCRAGTEDEGGIYTLNHAVEPDFPKLFPFVGAVPSAVFSLYENPNPTNIVIAVLDSGLEPEFMDLSDRVLHNGPQYSCPKFTSIASSFGWNFVDDSPDIRDDRGHGTLVTLNMVEAVKGLSSLPKSQVEILTVKVLDDCGLGSIYSTVCGLQYAAGVNSDIINASWGTYRNDRQLQRAISEVSDKGIKVVCSAGNNGLNLNMVEHFPSGYARQFRYINDDGSPGPIVTSDPNVFEIAGLCRTITDTCGTEAINLALWELSNFATTIFAEPSVDAQELVNAKLSSMDQIACQINGTSYAAPIFAAGLARQINNSASTTKNAMLSNSKRIHPDKNQYSYYLNNCQ